MRGWRRGGGQSSGARCSFLTPPLLLPQFPVKEQLYLSQVHGQLFRPETQWKDSAAVKINSFPGRGWNSMAVPRNVVYPASRKCWDRTRCGERGNKPGFCTWLALPPRTENSYPTDRWSCWIPFHGNILRSCWFSGWCSIIFIIFFSHPRKQFLFVDSIKQTFGPAVNREHTRPVAGSLWCLSGLPAEVCKSAKSNHYI